MRYSIDARLSYRVAEPCEVLLMLEAARTAGQRVVTERLEINAGPLARSEHPLTGSRQAIVSARGDLEIRYAAEVEVAPRAADWAGAEGGAIRDLPVEVLTYLRPSRYCPCDRFGRFARKQFGGLAGGALVEAIIGFVAGHLVYEAGSSDRFTTASETFMDGAGVCRDFAHLAITLCRAANVPARAVSAYCWRLDPPDLHAVIEVYLGGRWWVIDPTGKAPIDSLIRIATGRDAADISFMTIFGTAELVSQSFDVSLAAPLPGAPDLSWRTPTRV